MTNIDKFDYVTQLNKVMDELNDEITMHYEILLNKSGVLPYVKIRAFLKHIDKTLNLNKSLLDFWYNDYFDINVVDWFEETTDNIANDEIEDLYVGLSTVLILFNDYCNNDYQIPTLDMSMTMLISEIKDVLKLITKYNATESIKNALNKIHLIAKDIELEIENNNSYERESFYSDGDHEYEEQDDDGPDCYMND